MISTTAKDLLAQADRLMRQRIPEELPVLTDLVIDEIEPTGLTDRTDDANASRVRPAWAPLPQKPLLAPVSTGAPADLRNAVAAGVSASSDPTIESSAANLRDQLNAQLLTKLEELRHDVYSQVMQQLEIYAAGSLKDHVRDTLLPVLTDIARDIAQQVADDTSTRVREVVSKAVDFEFARLREQLSKQKTTDGRN